MVRRPTCHHTPLFTLIPTDHRPREENIRGDRSENQPHRRRTDQIGSVIENELPAYRAISRLAVFSLIFGFLALFSFAHWFFYLFAVLAIVAGIAANVTIKRYPDMLTGRGLASAGIAMGLIFGLVVGHHRDGPELTSAIEKPRNSPRNSSRSSRPRTPARRCGGACIPT